MECDLQVPPEEVAAHLGSYALFCEEVHYQQEDHEHQEGHANVVDVSEEVDVSCVGVEVNGRAVVEFQRKTLLPVRRVHRDILVLHFAEAAQGVAQESRRRQAGQEDVQPDFLQVVHEMGADCLQAQQEKPETHVNYHS